MLYLAVLFIIDLDSPLNKIAAAKSALITKIKTQETNHAYCRLLIPPSRDYYAAVLIYCWII